MTDDTTQMNLQWLQSTRNEDPVDYSIACKFKKPIYLTPNKIDTWDRSYLERKKEIGQEEFTLSDGRTMCYSIQGSGPVNILCFHGGGESKQHFLLKKNVPNCRLIAVDRAGCGRSSKIPEPAFDFTFENVVNGLKELLDHLQISTFIAVGHSGGSRVAFNLAAALPDRCKAVGLFSPMVDVHHPKMDPETKKIFLKKCPYLMPIINMERGCCRCLIKQVFKGMSKNAMAFNFNNVYKDDASKGAEMYQTFAADPFWVSLMCDSQRCGGYYDEICWITHRMQSADFYDISTITAPLFCFTGDGDFIIPVEVGQWLEKMLGAKLEIIKGCSHNLSFGPYDATYERIQRLVDASGLMN